MAMKETVRSLRAFFILSGIASLCFGFLGLAVNLQTAISPATLLVASIGIVGVFLSFPVCGRFSSRTRCGVHRAESSYYSTPAQCGQS